MRPLPELAAVGNENRFLRRIDLPLNRLAQNGDMSQDPTFGYESWQRPWPNAPRTVLPTYERPLKE